MVKITFQTLEMKIKVLREKRKIRDTDNFSRVYLRSNKSHVERLGELNARTILKEMPNGKDFRITGNGRMVKTNNRNEQMDQASEVADTE